MSNQNLLEKLKNKETLFLYKLAVSEGLDKIKHPVFGPLMSQVVKLLAIVDIDPQKVARIGAVLDRIKEEWNQ